MKKKCITNVVTDAGNQGQLPWLATLVTKVTMMVTTMVTMMVTMMVTSAFPSFSYYDGNQG